MTIQTSKSKELTEKKHKNYKICFQFVAHLYLYSLSLYVVLFYTRIVIVIFLFSYIFLCLFCLCVFFFLSFVCLVVYKYLAVRLSNCLFICQLLCFYGPFVLLRYNSSNNTLHQSVVPHDTINPVRYGGRVGGGGGSG